MHIAPGALGGYDGPVDLTLGRLAVFLGDPQNGERLLREAIPAAAAIGSAPLEAIARCELGELLARSSHGRERAEAQSQLDAAVGAAERLGMGPLRRRVTAALTVLQPAGAAGPLSRRELEIAELVAQGLTNPAIASRLHLSPRTAENHVKNILDKLGFHSRAQIAAWMAGRRGGL
jgi:DNA-binding NarL/FixJ family response regulator